MIATKYKEPKTHFLKDGNRAWCRKTVSPFMNKTSDPSKIDCANCIRELDKDERTPKTGTWQARERVNQIKTKLRRKRCLKKL